MQDGYISLRAFGRAHGVRLSAVQKAIKSKRVTDVLRNARGLVVGIHAENAWLEWQRNTDAVEALKNGKMYATAISSTRASTPLIEHAPRASLLGGEVQGNALHPAVNDAAEPAAQPGADSSSCQQTESVAAAGVLADAPAQAGEIQARATDAQNTRQSSPASGDGSLRSGQAGGEPAPIPQSEKGPVGPSSSAGREATWCQADGPKGVEVRPSEERRSLPMSSNQGVTPGETGTNNDQLPLTGQPANAASQEDAGPPAAAEPGFMEHRTKREEFLAKTAELDYLKQIGALVSTAEVEREVEEIFAVVKSNAFRIIPKKSAILAAETDPGRIERLLTDALTQAFHESSRAFADVAAGGAEERAATLP